MKKLNEFSPPKTPDIQANIHFGVSGSYRIQIHRADGTLRFDETFKNLVTNSGLDFFMQNEINSVNVLVGTGTNPPSPTDINMQTLVASQASGTGTVTRDGSPTYAINTSFVAAFGQGAAAGNLTEVGCRQGTGNVQSRALFLDGSGNPTTITVLSDEFLTVTYVFRLVPVTTDVTGTIGGKTFTIRPEAITTWFGAGAAPYSGQAGALYTSGLVAITASLTGTSITCTSTSTSAYVAGTFTRTCTMTWTPASGAITANTSNFWLLRQKWQIGWSPAIAKTASQQVVIGVTYTVARYP